MGHTFSIPSLGINVPLFGNNGNANLCAAAPCTLKSPHNIITFSFTSPGSGNYRWQCFVPCGSGWLFGNGGPMSDAGLHGRLHEGGGVSETQAAGTSTPAEPTEGAATDRTHHWWRLIAIWVVLSAVLDPLFYFLAGPHIPPGTMTDMAEGAQFDFNVLFIMRSARHARRVDLHGLRVLDVAGVAGAGPNPSPGPTPEATWPSRWAGSSPRRSS